MIFDIICLLIIIIGFVLGYRRGLLAQVGSVFGIILGIVCCNIFGNSVASHFLEESDAFEKVVLVTVMSYVLIFVVCYLTGRLCGGILSRIMKALELGVFNRIGGAVFTTFEYALIFSLLMNAFVGAFPNTEVETDYKGVKKFVLNLAPTVLGSQTIGDIYDKVHNTVEGLSER